MRRHDHVNGLRYHSPTLSKLHILVTHFTGRGSKMIGRPANASEANELERMIHDGLGHTAKYVDRLDFSNTRIQVLYLTAGFDTPP